MAKPPGDVDLLSAMAQRLTGLERQVQSLTAELTDRDATIIKLRGRIGVLEAEQAAAAAAAADTLPPGGSGHNPTRDLARQYAALQRRLHEMDTFLADYGLVWIGADDDDDDDDNTDNKDKKTWTPGAAVAAADDDAAPPPPAAIDFDKVSPRSAGWLRVGCGSWSCVRVRGIRGVRGGR